MTRYSLYKSLRALLLSMLFFPSCNGQDIIRQKQKEVNKPKTITPGQPKIIKPQGSHEYDCIDCRLQDKAGNLWFSTSWGVYRYNGKLFTGFTTKDGLCSNTSRPILEDQDGNIWFGSKEGLCRYDGKIFMNIPIVITNSSNYLPYSLPDNNPSATQEVRCMLQDKSGKFWLGTNDGIYCYNGRSFTRFLDNDGVINNSGLKLKMVDCIVEDKKGNIWFGSGVTGQEGACCYDPASRVITKFAPCGDTWVYSILETRDGKLLFVTRHHGVCRYDPSAALRTGSEIFTNITGKGGINNSSINAVLEDRKGNLWFNECTGNSGDNYDGGLWRFDGKSFTKFTTKDGLSHNGVWSIKEDRAGNIWVGTTNADLFRYDGKNFTSFTE